MKVVCRSCKKKFDFDMYMGLCPKCNTYYKEGMGSSEFSAYQQESNLQKRYDAHVEKKTEAKRCYHGVSKEHQKDAGKNTSVATIFLTVLVIIAVLIVVVPIVFVRYEGSVNTPQEIVQEEVVNISLDEKTSMVYEGEENTYTITITEVKADDGEWFGIPKGFELIALRYHIDVSDESVLYDENQIFSDIHMKLYLTTKKGEYLTPCYAYEIAEKKGWDYEQEKAKGLSEDFSYKDGVIFFGVREKQAKGLLVNSYNFDEEEYRETTVRESFQIEKMEVVR